MVPEQPTVAPRVMIYHWFMTAVLLVTGAFLVASNVPPYISLLVLVAGLWCSVCGYWVHARPFSGFPTAIVTHACSAVVMVLVAIGCLGIILYTILDAIRHPASYSGFGGLALVAAGALAIIGAVAVALAFGSRWAMRRFAAAIKGRVDLHP